MIFDGYAPTVRSSPVPLYMRGFEGLGELGDDFYSGAYASPNIPNTEYIPLTAPDFGTPSYFSSSPGIFAPSDPVLQPLLDSGMSYDSANLLADAAASGAITNDQFQHAISSKMSETQLENLILGAGTFAAVAATGSPKTNRPPAAKPPSTAQQIATAAAAATKATLGPGASPRVGTGSQGAPISSPFSGNTSIAGMVIPNIALLGVGAVLLLAVTKGGR
jgi:hypothetical protein